MRQVDLLFSGIVACVHSRAAFSAFLEAVVESVVDDRLNLYVPGICFCCRKLDRLSAGQYFGEMACLTGEKRKASVVTVTACELLSLSRGHLLQAMQAWPSVHAELLKALSVRRA